MNFKCLIVGFVAGFILMLGLSIYNGTRHFIEIRDEFEHRADSMRMEFKHQLDSAATVADSAKLKAERIDTVIIEIQGNEMLAINNFNASLDTLSDDSLKSAVIADLFY